MRINVYKGDQVQSVKEDRLSRFLDQGWRVEAEPDAKKISKRPKVEAVAEVIVEDQVVEVIEDEQTPTDNLKGEI